MLQKDIGAILVDMGVISDEQRQQYESASEEAGQDLETYLHEHNVVSTTNIAKAYAQKFEVPFFERITEKMIDTQLLSQVPLRFLRDNGIIPVYESGTCYLIVTDPYAFDVIDEVRRMLDEETSIAVAPRDRIIEALNRYYPI